MFFYNTQNICVYGEISSYNICNGIAYFNLKDESLRELNLIAKIYFDEKMEKEYIKLYTSGIKLYIITLMCLYHLDAKKPAIFFT